MKIHNRCARVLTVIALSVLFGCSSAEPADQNDHAARPPKAAACVFPECLSGEQSSHVVTPDDPAEALLKKTPLTYEDISLVAMTLPDAKRKDEYESTTNFKKRATGALNKWRKGDLEPQTRLLISKSLSEYDSAYDADKQILSIDVPFGPSNAVFQSRHSSSDQDYGGIRAVRELDLSDGLWFMNVRPAIDTKIDGMCDPKYPSTPSFSTVRLPMSADDARQVRRQLRILYVISFDLPASSRNGEWCYTGTRRGDGDAFLIKGGAMEVGSSTSFVNVHLHRIVIASGDRVLEDKLF